MDFHFFGDIIFLLKRPGKQQQIFWIKSCIRKKCSEEVDKRPREEQAVFREGRGTTGQIFILTNIIEQTVEWNSSLSTYIYCIGFERTFSAHQEKLWKLMKNYRIPEKLIIRLKCM